MPKKQFLAAAALAALIVIAGGGGFWWGFKTGEQVPQRIIIDSVGNIEPGQEQEVKADFSTFWQAWKLVEENHVKGKEVSEQKKIYGAIGGLVDSLGDPNSEFFSPQNSEKFQQDIRGNFGGIGAEIAIRKNKLL